MKTKKKSKSFNDYFTATKITREQGITPKKKKPYNKIEINYLTQYQAYRFYYYDDELIESEEQFLKDLDSWR